MKNHQSLKITEASLLIAEAQFQQAMSAYWPRLALDVSASRADQDTTYSLQSAVDLPNDLSDALAKMGAKPISSIPLDLELKLLDRDLLTASINLTYPIFTGGKRHAVINQAEKAIKIAKQGQRKSILQVIRNVKRFYYAAQFAIKMEQLTSATLDRFKVIEEITEQLYQNGSLKVKKTDYLRTKTTTALTKVMLNEAEYASQLAHQALANAMGIDWSNEITLMKNFRPQRLNDNLQALVDDAHNFNPDIQQLNLAVMSAAGKISETRSGYYPKLGFRASSHKIWSDFDGGLTNKNNNEGWTIGVELQWNLFDGFRTSARVDQAKAALSQLESQKVLLNQTTALQIKQQFIRLKSVGKQIKNSKDAVNYAEQNRKLHIRAYREELVETRAVIEAQIIETFSLSSLYRSQHDLDLSLIEIEFLVGKNIEEVER